MQLLPQSQGHLRLPEDILRAPLPALPHGELGRAPHRVLSRVAVIDGARPATAAAETSSGGLFACTILLYPLPREAGAEVELFQNCFRLHR